MGNGRDVLCFMIRSFRGRGGIFFDGLGPDWRCWALGWVEGLILVSSVGWDGTKGNVGRLCGERGIRMKERVSVLMSVRRGCWVLANTPEESEGGFG